MCHQPAVAIICMPHGLHIDHACMHACIVAYHLQHAGMCDQHACTFYNAISQACMQSTRMPQCRVSLFMAWCHTFHIASYPHAEFIDELHGLCAGLRILTARKHRHVSTGGFKICNSIIRNPQHTTALKFGHVSWQPCRMSHMCWARYEVLFDNVLSSTSSRSQAMPA